MRRYCPGCVPCRLLPAKHLWNGARFMRRRRSDTGIFLIFLPCIPSIIPPDLMKIMMEMRHGDELLICDGNYPKLGCPERCVRMDGHGIPEILDAILRFFPLDSYVEHPAILMAVLPNDPYKPEIWDVYREIGKRYE